jgi:hypothetical protein
MTNILNAAKLVVQPYSSSLIKRRCRASMSTATALPRSSGARPRTAPRVRQFHRHAAGGAEYQQHLVDLGGIGIRLHAAIGYVITGNLTLRDQIYMRPRLSDTVACNSC